MGRTDGPRSRSPTREHRHRRHRSRSPRPNDRPQTLPFRACELKKHDLQKYRSMFGLYLDIQKRKDIDELDESEVKGRWKSFMNKWNRGELAEGWYDPATLHKAVDASNDDVDERASRRNPSPTKQANQFSDSDPDDFGPALPSSTSLAHPSSIHPHTRGQGPSIPTTQDLRHAREASADAAMTAHDTALATYRASRREERKLQIQRLDELAPRAEPGSRDRQLEKKREAAASHRAFAQSAHDTGDMEVRESDVMGDADSLEELKRMKAQSERKKNERELRREEALRARMAEREERMAVHRAKEEKTMEMLRGLARERFGGGGGGG